MYLVYLLKIIYYFLFVFFMYFLTDRTKEIQFTVSGIPKHKAAGEKKYGWGIIIILGLALGVYSVICGAGGPSDRWNYSYFFVNGRKSGSDSYGLAFIEYLLHFFTNDPAFLFFVITFLCVALTVIAYNSYSCHNPVMFLFLGSTQYFFYSFYQLKQAPANGFAALSIIAFMEKQWWRCIINFMFAVIFHESSLILLPLYVLLLLAEKRAVQVLVCIISAFCLLWFDTASRLVVSLFMNIPGFATQIQGYLDTAGSVATDINYLTVFKGFPFYFLCMFSCLKHSALSKKIKNYDRYIMICLFVSITSLASAYMYWTWRLGELLYFPVCCFAALIFRNLESHYEKWILFLGFFGVNLVITLRAICQYYFLYGGFG